ncbi:hypothetical protein ACUULL_001934 [Vibrio cholerae]|uniref:hypothetical protein n=2 Tax=Vibrio cholerae TaxID=666 RepID=UPI0012B7F7A3|nr:hypothetical protein [Vibrio cholerae]EGS7960669.1 hypothetical protein [Vibrio cholerae]EKF9485765.1 hypothetical protein [Vibrio cholerae]MCU4191009.1 hypothetical protein [Vibrio cholerae]HCZ9565904.1 hypothetical protein [Vibrio cholerae]HCZ9568283.1 hypothetical protein [Vibrio cholerae]
MNKFFSTLVYGIIVFSTTACAVPNDIINSEEYSESFKDSFNEVYAIGPNFNIVDYIFTYGCGGGAICANIYDSKSGLFVDFPDNYIADSEYSDFSLDFNRSSAKLCINGQSAYDSKIYDDVCYEYKNRELLEIK